jgi:hypothetical protein
VFSSTSELYVRCLLNLNQTLCILVFRKDIVFRQCQTIKLLLLHNLFTSHDFDVHVRVIQTFLLCSIPLTLPVFISNNIAHISNYIADCLNKYSHECINLMNPAIDFNRINPMTDQFIGGGSRLFSFEELFPYLENKLHIYNNQYAFCFKEYIEQTCQDGGTLRCSVLLSTLMPKLTTNHLKMIATSHGIRTYARSHRSN